MTAVRPVQLSAAAAGDVIAAAAFPGPGCHQDDPARWLITELEKVITAAPPGHAAHLADLVSRARAFPGQQAAPGHLVTAATRHWRPFPMPLAEARAVLADPAVTCWWRPHPAIFGFDLLVMRPAEGLADPELARLFFQAAAPAGTQDGEPQ